jgi:hypothetical protein
MSCNWRGSKPFILSAAMNLFLVLRAKGVYRNRRRSYVKGPERSAPAVLALLGP